ncbi:hypothetical protein HDU96_002736 [Phlyctochytrium bullatum]|nr:hypothetical protein HDU96_002736 [Phlyctochytrium bullatum]
MASSRAATATGIEVAVAVFFEAGVNFEAAVDLATALVMASMDSAVTGTNADIMATTTTTVITSLHSLLPLPVFHIIHHRISHLVVHTRLRLLLHLPVLLTLRHLRRPVLDFLTADRPSVSRDKKGKASTETQQEESLDSLIARIKSLTVDNALLSEDTRQALEQKFRKRLQKDLKKIERKISHYVEKGEESGDTRRRGGKHHGHHYHRRGHRDVHHHMDKHHRKMHEKMMKHQAAQQGNYNWYYVPDSETDGAPAYEQGTWFCVPNEDTSADGAMQTDRETAGEKSSKTA